MTSELTNTTPQPDTGPWADLRKVQTWFAASPAFLDHLQKVNPEMAEEMARSLFLSQGKQIADLPLGQAMENLLSEDWVSDYHKQFLKPGNWDPQLIENTAAGSVRQIEIDARTYQLPSSKFWIIGLSSDLVSTLRFVAEAVLEAALISETNGDVNLKFRADDEAITEAARKLGRCLGGILELGYADPSNSSSPETERLSLSLAVFGARFVYQHELSHLLLKHEQKPILADDSTYIQQAVRNHLAEFEADRNALKLMALGYKSNDQGLALTYAGASLFLQVLQWLDRFRGHSPDTHPTSGARLDRLRIRAPEILNNVRPNAFGRAHSLEYFLHRLFIEVQDRLEADVTLISSPVNETVNSLSEPDKPPGEKAVQYFLSKVALWLTLGIPRKVMTSLGQMKADADLSNDQGITGLVDGLEGFLNGVTGDPAAARALADFHAAEEYRLQHGA